VVKNATLNSPVHKLQRLILKRRRARERRNITHFATEVGKFNDITAPQDYEYYQDKLREALGRLTGLDDEIHELIDDRECDADVQKCEALFHLDAYVNKQNCRFWAAENPRELHQRPLHTANVSIWCGISKVGIVGPYFFEEAGAAVTVTSERYVEMLRNFLRPQLQSLRVNMEEMWFQQDGATAHTARVRWKLFDKCFRNT